MDYTQIGQSPTMDPRMVQEIASNPKMAAEQGEGFLQAYGGPENYIQMARMPYEQRLVYAATLDGHTEPADIADVTGLSQTQVSKGLTALSKQGYMGDVGGAQEVLK